MYKTAINVGALLYLLSLSTQVFSQNAKCPSTNRVEMGTQQASADPIDFSDGSYKLIMGSANFRGGPLKTLTTMVYHDGKCLPGHFTTVQGGRSGHEGLQENANLCLGDKNDNVEVLTKTTEFQCGKNKRILFPFIYNGYKLSIYGGGGNDLIKGGNGQDKIHGGNGTDWIDTNTGDFDRAFGESGADVVVGSTGNSTITNGGSGKDTLRDSKGTRDFLIGGTDKDNISSACGNATIICEPSGRNGNDIARSRSRPKNWGNCQNWVKAKCTGESKSRH